MPPRTVQEWVVERRQQALAKMNTCTAHLPPSNASAAAPAFYPNRSSAATPPSMEWQQETPAQDAHNADTIMSYEEGANTNNSMANILNDSEMEGIAYDSELLYDTTNASDAMDWEPAPCIDSDNDTVMSQA